VLSKYKVEYFRVKGIASDSAPYMTLCVTTLRGIIGEHLLHFQCWTHKLDKVEKIPMETLPRLNEFIKKTKKVFKNSRKRRNRYRAFLEGKYGKEEKAKIKLFPLPIMCRFSSWKKSADYVTDYVDDLVEFVQGLPGDDVTAVDYFKRLTPEDVLIVKAESAFVTEHCSAVSNLLKLTGNNTIPLAHRLYPELEEVITAYALLENSENLEQVLGEKTKAAIQELHRTKKKNVKERFQSVAKKCQARLKSLMESDSANDFFSSCALLFHPVKIMSASLENLTGAFKNLTIFRDLPMNELLVLHAVLKENVQRKLASQSSSSSKGDAVFNVLTGMLATHESFAGKCLNVMFYSVSNLDTERAFSAYGDVVSPKRSTMSVRNAETYMALYFGDEIDDEIVDVE